MRFGKFRIGLRTIKSSLAVMICILLFHFIDGAQPMIAALSAVFSLRQDLTTSVSFGKSRILGNTIGGLMAAFYFFLRSLFPQSFLVELFILPILVALCIIISDGINNNSGIVSAIATMLLIALSVTESESMAFAFSRVIETFIGTFIAIGLNVFASPKPQERESQIKEDLNVLRKKETALKEQLAEVERQIEENSQQN